MSSDSEVLLSVVVPVYRGADYLEALVDQIGHVRHDLEQRDAPLRLVEVMLVNDAAIDDSGRIVHELAQQYDWVRGIELSKNFGQHFATIAGILHSCGDWIATLDEDLQHSPREMERMLARAVSDRLDLVYARPKGAVHRSWFRNLSSKWFKSAMSWLSRNRHIRHFNSFRMIRGDIARAAASVCSHNSYLDIVLCWFTDRIASLELPLEDLRSTTSESSGYDLGALLRHAKRLAISSENRLLSFSVGLGSFAVALSVVASAMIVGLRLFAADVIELPGWTSLILAILFFGGLLALLQGIALEFLSSLLLRTQGKPTYFATDRRRDEALSRYFAEMGSG